MELQGKIIAVLPAREGTSARGPWKSQEYVIETHDQYPKKMVFNVFGADRIDQFAIKTGEEIIVSFDIADNWDDETTVVLEISGDGTIVDGQSATLSKIFAPTKNTDSSKPWQWTRNHQVKIEGATANTKITIRSSQKGISGYYRWFLDNIKVTRTTTNN